MRRLTVTVTMDGFIAVHLLVSAALLLWLFFYRVRSIHIIYIYIYCIPLPIFPNTKVILIDNIIHVNAKSNSTKLLVQNSWTDWALALDTNIPHSLH